MSPTYVPPTFCPSCGNPSLLRCSITYVTPTPQNPKGYIIHLHKNFQYRNRGTRYSIPNPQKGSAKGTAKPELVLREDQKEWMRAKKRVEEGLKRADRKQQTGYAGADPDWMPAMLQCERERRKSAKTKTRGGLLGEMPKVGYGKKVCRHDALVFVSYPS
jgi:RNA-binding protein NOB1